MSGDYKGLLRTIYGEPTVDCDLLGTVTSVGEGDEDAYAAALVAIGRSYGHYCVEPVIEDERTPGVVLDAILGGWPTEQRLWHRVAKHPNVTANVERWCRQKRSVKLNAALAASPGVSDETVKRLLRSQSMRVIEALLGNAALSEDVLRRAERRARAIGMSVRDISWKGGRNASMPADVLESWLSSSDKGVRHNALISPVAPRAALWEHITRKTVFDSYSYPGIDIFPSWSNADGDMIDWFLSRWEKQVGGALRSNFPQRIECQWTAVAAGVRYFGVNQPVSQCFECDYSGEFAADVRGFYCPECGERDEEKTSVVRRVCGYLGSFADRPVVEGKRKEIVARVKHLRAGDVPTAGDDIL